MATRTYSIAMSETYLPTRDKFGKDNDAEDLAKIQTQKEKVKIVPKHVILLLSELIDVVNRNMRICEKCKTHKTGYFKNPTNSTDRRIFCKFGLFNNIVVH